MTINAFRMKKTLILVAVAFLGNIFVHAKSNDDPVLMKINGKNITRSEFEYSYNKNNSVDGAVEKKSVGEYVDMFINYKLKVEAALDARMDTLESFRNEFQTYRDMQLTPFLIDTVYIDSLARQVYDRTKARLNGADLVHPAHIFLRLRQDATPDEKESKRQKADSIYAMLKRGADFGQLARKYSDDAGSAEKGGQLPWIGPNATVKEFEDAAYALKTGELSSPVLSPVGYHIIYMTGRKPLEPYEQRRSGIIEMLKQRGIEATSSEHKIKDMIARSGNRLTREAILDSIQNDKVANDNDLRYLIQEYHDGLLLYEISKQKVWDVAANDSIGLAAYFKKNKKKYRWTEPRFKGFVYYTKREEMLKPVAKTLKKSKDASWRAVIDSTFNNDSTQNVKVQLPAYYKQGDNKYVDELVFKGKKATRPDGYPYVGVAGRKLKQPKECRDVYSLALNDYQEMLEKQWVELLRRKYAFEVEQDVLKTVNNHE